MKYRLIFFVLCAFKVSGQKKTIGEFTTLIVQDGLHVTLIKGETDEMVMVGNNKQGVRTQNKDGQLRINMKPFQTLHGIDANIELFYTGTIDKIDLSRGAYLTTVDTIQTEEINIRSSTGAEIELMLEVNQVNYSANTGGKITAKGFAEKQRLHISTGGRVNAQQLLSKETTAKILFGGSCDVQTTSFFDLTTRFGGLARLHGKPLKTTHNKTLGGTILFTKTPE